MCSLTVEREALSDCPNVLYYQRILDAERAGYLVRQWVASNLYDRIRCALYSVLRFRWEAVLTFLESTRPFLSLVEKRWIAFQLLTALKETHARDVSLLRYVLTGHL